MNESHETFSSGNKASTLLASNLQFVKGVGPVKAGLLARLNLFTIQDLLFLFPTAHKDRMNVTPIREARSGDVNIVAQIVDVTAKRFNGKEQIKAYLKDANGDQIVALWWNPWIADRLMPQRWGFFSGKISTFGSAAQLNNCEFELFDETEFDEKDGASSATGPSFGRIVPIYNLRPKTRLPDGAPAPEIRINQNFLRKVIWAALEKNAAAELQDQLPEWIRQSRKLMPLAEAIREFHFPATFASKDAARRRLAFEELFVISLGVALRRAQIERLECSARLRPAPAILQRIDARLPFKMTAAQSLAFGQIAADMARATPMNRLLQGDVGSGKTAVAVAALLLCVAHGHQAVLLAPTEALALQHHRTLLKLLKDSRVEVGLLKGGLNVATREDFLARLRSGTIHIAVGTHALLEPGVAFKSLALIVVDEQHKFGVAQRLALRAKGRSPHVLVMTATPIPRTLTLILYGDLDVSVLNEMPPGRGEISTKWLTESEREKVYKLILSEAKKGHSTYIVFPRIKGELSALGDEPVEEDSWADGEPLMLEDFAQAVPKKSAKARAVRLPKTLWGDVKGAEAEFKRLQEHLPTLRVELLHGRLPAAEKQRVLELLAAAKIDVLVSTQVIEVGIDLPTATVMLIENAERFGLSSLHQLRGRVGRSERKSWCLFFCDVKSDEAEERLKAFEKTRDGFQIAEVDFKLRGPGQFFGTKQSGMPELKVADLIADAPILADALEAAKQTVRVDPSFSRPEHMPLRKRIREVLGKRIGLVDVG